MLKASGVVAMPASPMAPDLASGAILRKGTAVVIVLISSSDCALNKDEKQDETIKNAVMSFVMFIFTMFGLSNKISILEHYLNCNFAGSTMIRKQLSRNSND